MQKSAGILLYRISNKRLEVFLGHPGGPYYQDIEDHCWSIPKGGFKTETSWEAAVREFREETSFDVSDLKDHAYQMSSVVSRGRKTVYTFAIECDVDETKAKSNLFNLEWPPKSGNKQRFPELDRHEWFDLETAKRKILHYQLPLLYELMSVLDLKKQITEETIMTFDKKDAKILGDILKIDWNKYDIEQFVMGLNVELEHGKNAGPWNVTDDDPVKTAKIALAHLDEKENYYSLLKKYVED